MKKFSLFLLCLGLVACAKNESRPPMVAEMKQTKVTRTASATALPKGQSAVVSEITLTRSALLNRTFLYGTSLQTSSMQDGDISVTLMGIALGQAPAQFRVLDNRLRLETDSRLDFESDVNHPARLIHDFPILRQDSETITIRADGASPLIDTFLLGTKNAVGKRASWIRSMEYAAADDLFLIESSVELVNGTVAEFMETLTPRDRVVPADAKPILVDEEHNPASKRYRFLEGSKVFMNIEGKRVKTAAAQRFFVQNGQPIKWHVTRNVPEAYLLDVKNGIEAWNRYSQAMWGRDLVRFEGRLPEGVKIGDPRFNIVIWDNVQEAGAAYESQNSDPLTGMQTHSLIYLPLAWVNIGKEYWNNASRTEENSEKVAAATARILKSREFLGRALPVNCIDGAHHHVSLRAKESPEEFARTLLKGVLFHEMGHALGLAHNFKGSLSFDPDRSETLFSTSIMDYNQYNEEGEAFSSLDSANGPLLEYDRQIISVLYNEGKDIKDSDPKLPACADAEADSQEGGVDPLCVRYDIGTDPTKQALRALELIQNREARNGRMSSLALAIPRALGDLPSADTIDTVAKAKAGLVKLLNAVRGTTSLYIGGSANSLAYLGSQAMKSLFVYRDDVLPAEYKEAEMRERALSLLESVAGTGDTLPEASRAALTQVREAALAWLQTTPAFTGASEDERSKAFGELRTLMEKHLAATEASVLSRARVRVLGALNYSASAPLSFHSRQGQSVDLEEVVVGLLEKSAGAKAGASDRPTAERKAALAALVTYAKTSAGKEAMERARLGLQNEIRLTRDATQREELRKLAALLP